MNSARQPQCEKEARVIKSVRTGFWDGELRRHLANCLACSEAALAACVLNEMRAVDEAEARIPDAGLMWWKAQLRVKRAAGEKATQPINLVEWLAYGWAIICAVGVCVWQRHAIREWLASIRTSRVKVGIDSVGSMFAHFARILNPTVPGRSAFAGWGLLIAGGATLLLLFALFLAMYIRQSEK
jgi:hypothetical protein